MEVAELARELVAIPSHESEAAAGDFVADWLRDHTDADVTRDDAGVTDRDPVDGERSSERGRGGNVIARKGTGDTALALVGHHDVVSPDESQVERDDGDGEYVVAERDGRLYGRGSADMKGALAAAMCAFRDADPGAGAGDATDAELVFASFVGEEVGGVGARYARERGFAPDYAVVGEGSTGYSAPGVTDVAVAHKGRRGSTIVAEGTAAHASEPDAGANAVYRATDAVDVVRDLAFPSVEVMGRDVSGSVAVTGIEGGSAWNVIPERCEVTVDERTVPGERAPLDRVEEIEGVSWRVDQDLPPMECDDPAFADAVLEVARDVHERERDRDDHERDRHGPDHERERSGVDPGRDRSGDDTGRERSDGDTERERNGTERTEGEREPSASNTRPEHVVKPHATDAGWLSEAGTTCVVCGPAEPGEAHTDDESVSLAVLDRCYRIYRGIAESWPQ